MDGLKNSFLPLQSEEFKEKILFLKKNFIKQRTGKVQNALLHS